MAYRGDPEKPAGRRRPGIFMAACAAAILSLAAGCSSGGEPWTPERVDGKVQEQGGEARELYAAIKASYPDEYRRFLGSVAETMNDHDSWQIHGRARDFARHLMSAHFDGLARAPDADLLEIARQYAQLVGTIQRSTPLVCTYFLAHGALPDSATPADQGTPPEARAIEIRIKALMIRAASAGEHAGVTRAALTPAERQALLRAAASHAPDAAALLTHPGNMESAPSEQQCAAGAAVYGTIAGMPPEMAAKAIISLLHPPAEPGAATGR